MVNIKSKYFIRKDKGGYSPCINGNPQIYEGCTLNNCVGAAWGLFAEAEGNPNCTLGDVYNVGYPQDASKWFNGKDGYERGKEPKVGAVACFKNHVMYVTEVKSNGDIVCLESGYGAKNSKGIWQKTLTKESNYYRGKIYGEFQGFIYPKSVKVEEPKKEEAEIKKDNLFVGDTVKIISTGNSKANGTGRKSYGIGWTRKIIKYRPKDKYPYLVGLGNTGTGWYQASALSKIK